MITMMRRMWTCHWAARRVQRYLDADPAAPLTPGEVARLEQHLATCADCSRLADEHRAVHRALAWWPGRRQVDPAAVRRMRDYLDTLTRGEADA